MDQKLMALPLADKIKKTKEILLKALTDYPRGLAIAWTGGKDSTLTLFLLRQVCQENNLPLPSALFIDEGNVFEETVAFVKKWRQKWQVQVHFAKNNDVLSQAEHLGDPVFVKKLNLRNQAELKRLGFTKACFPFEPESMVGCHLMKTVVMNEWFEKNQIQAFITGVRWDEQGARENETHFSPRQNPDHLRVHPILHFREADVWQAIKTLDIPYVKLYEEGYRSLGAKCTTTKVSDKPAWEQDLAHTTERAGRKQDKEKIMQRLRKLGYM